MNPSDTPAGISLAAGEYHAKSAYHEPGRVHITEKAPFAYSNRSFFLVRETGLEPARL